MNLRKNDWNTVVLKTSLCVWPSTPEEHLQSYELTCCFAEHRKTFPSLLEEEWPLLVRAGVWPSRPWSQEPSYTTLRYHQVPAYTHFGRRLCTENHGTHSVHHGACHSALYRHIYKKHVCKTRPPSWLEHKKMESQANKLIAHRKACAILFSLG